MTQPIRRAALTALVAALVVLGSGTSAYAAEGRIVSAEQGDGTVQFVFTADGLADGVTIDPASVEVVADDWPLPAEGAPVTDDAAVARTAVLVIDVSRSMSEPADEQDQEGPTRIDAAKDAASAYVDSLPDDVLVGLVAFDETVRRVQEPTDDHAAVIGAIGELTLGQGTALYSGVVEGAAMAASSDGAASSVLLLADGGDSPELEGTATLEEALQAVESSGAHVDAVAIGDADSTNLQTIAETGGGSVVVAGQGVAELTAVFEQAAQAITNQVLVTAQIVPEVAGREVPVTVSANAGDERVSASGILLLGSASPDLATDPDAPGGQPVQAQGFVPTSWLALAIIGLFLGLAVILAVALAGATAGASGQARVKRRLSFYSLGGRRPAKTQETTVLGQTSVARSAIGLADKVVKDRDFEVVLATKLDSAGMSMRPAEWLLLHVGIALGAGLLFLLLSGIQLVPALVGIALGVVGPFLFLAIKESRRRSAFLAQLPDTLQLMAGSLSAGYSMPQAIDTVVREGSPPISTEFNRALVEARLGVPVEDALEGVADRMKSKDFAWVIMAIRIQRQVGGNLAELLTTVAATLRERERLRRQVQVLSAEGRLSAWILAALPIGFAVYLLFARGEYLAPLWTDPLGWAMLLLGAVLMAAGALWLRKVVQVEV